MSVDSSTMATMSLASSIGGLITGAGAAEMSARNTQFQARMAGRAAEANSKLAEWQAADAERRGNIAARDRGTRTQLQMGSQRAAMAGAGIRIGSSETALAILDDTRIAGDLDISNIQQNAMREASGARIAAANASAQGKIYEAGADAIRPGLAAANTILGGAGQVADRWYRYNKANA